ncbi:tetratricopeptide repeat protein [Actinomycetota bacterium Odt1-20B]
MDAELAALAAAGGSALVRAAATDAWVTLRDRVAELFGRNQELEGVLDQSREALLAPEDSHARYAEGELTGELRRLLADNPAAADELRALVKEFEPSADRDGAMPEAAPATSPTPQERPAPRVSRDHVDFSKGTFHGSVIGAQHIYGSRGGGAHAPDWRPAQELGPAEIGVRPTRRAPGFPDIPPYAARDIDPELAAALDGGGFVLLLGKPCSGTSYTAWNALRALDGHQVYAPERGADLRALLGPVKENPGQYVLWLDDIEGHLGERGLEPSLLERFKVLGVRVLATMDPDTYYERRTGSSPGDRAIAHARTVELPGRWTEAEFARLAEHIEDPRSYEAYLWSESGNPPAHLALGHLLHEEWQRLSAREAAPAGVAGIAVVRAALDVARCGYAGAVPLELLVGLGAPGETEWAGKERCGYAGFLVPGEKPATWRAHEALVAGELRAGEPVADELRWDVYNETASGSPEERAVLDGLIAVLRARARAGDRDAAYDLTHVLLDGDENESWLRAAADRGHADAMDDFAAVLQKQGKADEALTYLERSTANGSAWAAARLARHYRTRAEEILTPTAAERRGNAVALGDLIAGTPGREAEALRHYLTAWRSGGGGVAALRIADFLRDHGRPDEAEAWYRHAAEAGGTLAAHSLGLLLAATRGLDPEVEQLLTRAADAGHAPAATALGVLKAGQGDIKAARALYKKGDAGGDPEAAYRMGCLMKNPAIRKEWLQRAATRGHYQAGKDIGAFEPPPAPDTVEE